MMDLQRMPVVCVQLNEYQTWLQASGASPGTCRLRVFYLSAISDMYAPTPLLELSPAQLVAFMGRPGWSPETRQCVRSSLRSFFRYAVDVELIERDPTRKLPSVRVPAGKPHPTPESTLAQALLAASPRVTLMILLGAYAGLRRAEIARCHTNDIDGDQLRVCGKGGVTRIIPLHPRIIAALDGVPPGWLFPGRGDNPVSPGHVGKLVAHLLGPGWSAHSLRHRFASATYLVERDLLCVQELLGHSDPKTTRRYTQVPADAKLTAVMGMA